MFPLFLIVALVLLYIAAQVNESVAPWLVLAAILFIVIGHFVSRKQRSRP